MEKFFQNFKRTFSKAAGKVAKKSGEVFEVSKLTLAIAAANNEIEAEYEKIGKLIYEGYKNDSVQSEEVTVHCALIDSKLEEIEEYKEKLSAVKAQKICPFCKAEISKESTFCAKCGEKL